MSFYYLMRVVFNIRIVKHLGISNDQYNKPYLLILSLSLSLKPPFLLTINPSLSLGLTYRLVTN